MSKRILMFESDSAFAGSVARRLERSGLTVEVTDDGNRGCEMAVKQPPALILLAIELPNMNGFLVCKKLKKAPESANIPVIILSSDATEEIFEAHRNLRTRADVYLRKPIAIEDLMAKIRAFVPLPEVNSSELSLNDMDAVEQPQATEIGTSRSGLWSEGGEHTAIASVPKFGGSEFEHEAELSTAKPKLPRSMPPPINRPALPKEATGQHRIDALTAAQDELSVPGTGVRPREISDRISIGSMPAASSSGGIASPMSGSLTGIPSQAPRGREYLDLRETLNKKERELLDTKDELRVRDREILDLRDKSVRLERELTDEQAGQLVLERELEALRETNVAFELDRAALAQRLDGSVAQAETERARANKLEQDLQAADAASRRQLVRLETQLSEQQTRAELDIAQMRDTLSTELEQQRHGHGEELLRFRGELEQQRQTHLEALQQQATEFDAHRAEALASLEAQLRAENAAALAEHDSKAAKETRALNAAIGEMRQQLAAAEQSRQELDAAFRKEQQQQQAALLNSERSKAEIEQVLAQLRQRRANDEAVLERVRRAMAIGATLLEEQRNLP